ncbi:MAG: enolase-phosphatase E1 [Claussenomyces sp. TS43310]|nr:MAG: enolase-phosphatase E1 [Claussenomyces sp. TS43310]
MVGQTEFQHSRVVLMDIEGTVCPVSFVKEVLFPYALQVLPTILADKWDDESFRPYQDAFPSEYRDSPKTFETHVRDLMAQDLKLPYLKMLQGYLWLSGYKSGELKCPLFPDVVPAVRAWHERSIPIVIYSSGSVAAQKLLFQYTDSTPGDLRPLIEDYFDTVNAGPKTDPKSYEKIVATNTAFDRSDWLFLSDNVKEVDAARVAGMQAAVVVRPGNAPLSAEEEANNRLISSFDQVKLT